MTDEPTGGPPTAANVVRGISWVTAGQALSQAAWFGSMLLLAALLPPAAYGSVAIAMVVVQVTWLLVGSGTRGSFVVSPTVTPEQVRYALLVNGGSGLLLGALAALLAGPLLALLSPSADPDVLRVLALAIATCGLANVPLALLQKHMLFKRHALVMAAAALGSSVAAVAAALAGAGVWSLVLRQVVFQVILTGAAWWAGWRLIPRGRSGEPRRISGRPPEAKWFFALTVCAFLGMNADYVIVGHVLDVEMLGVYSLAFTLAFAPVTQFAWQVGKVFLAAAAAIATPAEVGRRAVRATTATSLLLVPLVIPAIALAPLLPAVLGDRWAPMVTPLRILLAVGVVHAVLAVIREFLNGAGFVSLSARIELLWLVGMVAALVPAVSLDGIRGAALAHVATLVPLTAAYLWLGLRRRLDVGLGTLAAAFRPLAVLGAAQAGTTAAVLGLLEAAGAPELTAAVVASCAGLAWVPALAERVQPGLRERAARMLSSRLRARPPHPAPQ